MRTIPDSKGVEKARAHLESKGFKNRFVYSHGFIKPADEMAVMPKRLHVSRVSILDRIEVKNPDSEKREAVIYGLITRTGVRGVLVDNEGTFTKRVK